MSASLSTPGAFGAWHTKRHILCNLNDQHGDFRRVFFEHFRELLESNDEAFVCRLMNYVRLILSMYMFVRVERPRGSKRFVMGYVKCDWVFSFAKRFEQMLSRLNSVPPTLLTEVDSEENKELRLAIIGETNYERALTTYRNDNGKPPLNAALEAKDEDAAEVLLDGGDDPNDVDELGRNALHMAAYNGCSPPLFRRILDMIQNVNARSEARREGRSTALILASRFNRLDMVVSLMKHQEIDVNVKDDYSPALHWGVYINCPAILTQLLSDGRINSSPKNQFNKTPLFLAIVRGYDECVKILREHGAEE